MLKKVGFLSALSFAFLFAYLSIHAYAGPREANLQDLADPQMVILARPDFVSESLGTEEAAGILERIEATEVVGRSLIKIRTQPGHEIMIRFMSRTGANELLWELQNFKWIDISACGRRAVTKARRDISNPECKIRKFELELDCGTMDSISVVSSSELAGEIQRYRVNENDSTSPTVLRRSCGVGNSGHSL